MVKSKAKKIGTGQDTDIKPPTIHVEEAPPGLPQKESFGRRTKEKVHNFLSNLRPSQSRASSRSRSEGGKSQESLPLPHANINTNTGGSVGKKNDMAEEIKSTDQTSPESIGKAGEAADVTAGSVTELKTTDKATVETAIKEAQEQVQVMHTLGGGLQAGAGLPAQATTVLDKVDTVSNLLQPLKVFDSVIKQLGDLHPYAKIALSVLSWASQVIIAQANRDKSILGLQSKISEVYKFMIEDGQLEKIVSIKDILSQTSQVMLECAKFIQSYSEPDFLKRLGKGMFSSTDEAVATYNKTLDRLMEQFHRNAMRDVLVATHDVRDDVRRTLEDLRQLGDNQYLNAIAYAEGAGMDRTKACLEDTRQEILHEVVDWVNSTDPNTPAILWLSGAAGTGKSAIAQTIARGMKDAGALGSCFCFEKGDTKRYTKMFSTISRDLASRDLRLKQALASVVACDPSIGTTVDVTLQWEKLITEPLSVIAGNIIGRLVIVIDALDESGDDKRRKHILTVLAKDAAALPKNIRILLTSRPLPDIRKALGDAEHVKCKSMDEISPSFTERDIQSYISYQLSDVDDTFSAVEIAELARRSGGLFEYARLACDYIKSTKAGLTAKEHFNDLMSRTEKEGTELLDDMYKVNLKTIMGETPNARVLSRFRSVMCHVLFTFEPLPIDALLAMHRSNQDKQGQFDAESTILRPMASLLSGIHDRSMPIRPLHSSFHDFLIDRERSGDFFVNEADAHLDLALASLRIMRQDLQFNICRLENSYMRNSEVSNLAQRVKRYISPQLSYSCRFLANHIEGIVFVPRVADMLQALLGNEQTLFWIETLGVLQCINTLPGSLSIIANWLENKEGYDTAAALVKECIQLVRNFGSVISESTPHLYLSVLPYLPQDSIISRLFSPKFPLVAKLPSGRPADWPPIEFLLIGHTDKCWSVVFSPDGKLAASGSCDNTIRVWDTEVGLLVGSPFKGHMNRVDSVAFSPDGKQIVSCSSDRSIRIWDTMSGSLVRDPIYGHSEGVTSVAFSPDGKRIVSGSSDKTICIWDVETGQRISRLFEHSGAVFQVAFSPNGQRIISGSADTTICVWDAMTGLQVFKPLQGHFDSVLSVAFSPDGRKIVSGSKDKTICIWNAETGLQIGPPLKGHSNPVYSVLVSPNGKWIVSGSDTIRLWDIETRKNSSFKPPGCEEIIAISMSLNGKKFISGSNRNTVYIGDIGILEVGNGWKGHNQAITSVAFSPDGSQIVSGSDDFNICIWDAKTGALIKGPLECHSDPVYSVAFSPDGEKIASGSDDTTVCIWDAKTGLQLGSLLRGHKNSVMDIAFSPDSKQIVSCSEDKTICIWDVNTFSQVGKCIEGHNETVWGVVFSPDGERIVSCSADETICIWDAKTGMQVGHSLTGHTGSVSMVAFSPDGTHIVSGSSDCTIRIWDAKTGLQVVRTSLNGHDNWVLSVAFSPDGERIVSGSVDQTVRIWDGTTGMEAVGSPLNGYAGFVYDVAFSPDGRQIVSCSSDVTIRVWEVGSNSKTYKNINISSKVEHTLCNAEELFDDTNASAEKWRDYVFLNNEGWIVGPEGRLLLWVPVQSRNFLHTPGTVLVLPNPAIELDLSVMAHGKMWMKCFDSGSQ